MISTLRPSERNFIAGVDLTVSNFDRVTSWLKASLIFCSLAVLAMSLVWLLGFQSDQRHSWTEPFGPVDTETIREIALPNINDNVPLPEQTSPSAGFLEATDELSLEDVLSRSITAVSYIQAESDEISTHDIDSKKRQGKELGGVGLYYPTEIGGVIPTHKRWRFEFRAENFDEYQRQLESVGVVIGIAERDDAKITKIRMKAQRPEIFLSNREQESTTLRFGHRQPRLENWDRRIAKSVNVVSSSALVFHLIEPKMHALLWELEKAEMEANHRQLYEVAKTVFEIADVNGQFQFRVGEQRFR